MQSAWGGVCMLGNLQTVDHTNNIHAASDESAQDAASSCLDLTSSIHCSHVDVTFTPTDSPNYSSMGNNNMHETAGLLINFVHCFLFHYFYGLLYCVTISAKVNNLYLVLGV